MEEAQNTSILSYGSRMRGYFIAPSTGQYLFGVAADDTAAFSLSSDDNPAKKAFVTAKVSAPSNSRQWNYAGNLNSTPPAENQVTASLTAGKRYYIELLHKQDSSLDCAAVAYVFSPQLLFDTPGSETAPITDIFDPLNSPPVSGPSQLSPAIDALRVVTQPVGVAATQNQVLNLIFDVSGSAPRTVQWSLDQGQGAGPVDIPGATFPVYNIPNFGPGDVGTYVCRQSNQITTTPINSNAVVVSMIDTTPATVTSVVDNFDTLAGGKTVVVNGTHFIPGMGVTINGKVASLQATLSNKASTGTVVTLTTAAPHNFILGQPVTVACAPADANIDGTAIITSIPTPTTFTYNKVATAVVSAATGGTAVTPVAVTPTAITLTVPSSTVKGAVNVAVTKPGLAPITLTGGFTYDDISVAASQTITINEDTPTSGATITATDPSDKIVSFTIVQQPKKGTLTLPIATLKNKASTGTVVTMTTTAAHGFTMNQSVNVACNPPDANIDTVGAIITSVPSPTTFTYAKTAAVVASTATGGTVQLITNTTTKPFTGSLPFVYSPNTDTNNNTPPLGPDTFTFVVSDGILTSLPATVTINVTPVNDPPTINLVTPMTVPEDKPVTVNLTGIFVGPVTAVDEIATQTITSVTAAITTGNPATLNSQDGLNTNTLQVTNFNATAGTATLSFTPAFPGSIVISVTVVDTGSGTAPNVNTTVLPINVTVTSVNDAPVINPVPTQTGTADVAGTINLSGIAPAPPNNPDEAAQASLLTLTVTASDPTYFSTLTAHPTITSGTATITYVPSFARNGPVTITVVVDDHQSVNNQTSISFVLNLAPVNHAPVAVNDSYAPTINKVFSVPAPGVLANDTDADNNQLTVALIGPGTTNGTLVLNPDGSFVYTPNQGFSGTDSFQYQANDGQSTKNLSNVATVTLTMGPNVAPVASNATVQGTENVPSSSTLTATDANFDTLTYAIVTPPSSGTLTAFNAATGAFTYTPNQFFHGTDSFTFKANDGQLDSNVATVTLNIAFVDQAPVGVPQTVFVGQNRNVMITLTATDEENDALTFSIVTAPVNGVLSAVTQAGSESATVVYTPKPNFVGSDSFQFKAKDATLFSQPTQVSISVTPPPVFSVSPTIVPNPAITGSPVTFSATADVINGTATIAWNFGDGSTGVGSPITHTYTQSGVFVVATTATSPEGLSVNTTESLLVGVGLVSPGNSLQPGIFGFLVGGTGITAGDKAQLTVNYVNRSKTIFAATVAGIKYPASLNQGQLVNQVGILTLGQGNLAQQFVFTLNAAGSGKATGLPTIQLNLAKGTLAFKATSRSALTDLIISLGAGNTVQGNGQQILDIPVTLQIGNSLLMAMTFELNYQQAKTTGKGELQVVKNVK